jgi:predicted molibdopterin-dependent oxidoreductase YjgC
MKITIDHLTVDVEGRKSVLDAARESGIYIPSLCDHPRLVPFSGCRLCVIEVRGRRGVVPACGTYAEDGMVVVTSSLSLQKMRLQILDLILSEHPSACLICREKETCEDHKSTIRKVGEVTGCVLCPNNGRCDLQTVVEHLKPDNFHFPAFYRDQEIHRKDPFFERNDNLCVLCGRCVRICHEVRGASTLAFVNRGSQTVIGTALNRPLLDSGCQFCGACVDVCPTGALTEKAVKYEMLPDEKRATICGFCSQGCGLTIHVKQGRIQASVPAESGPVNRGQACVRGRFLVRDAVHHPRRALKPLVRKNGRLEETGWDEALGLVARRFAATAPRDIAVFGSAQDPCEDLFILRKFAREGLKTPNLSGVEAFSAPARLLEAAAEQDIAPPLNGRISDIAKSRVILLFGNCPPMVGLEIHQAVKNGARLIVVGGKESPSIRCASAWLKIPGGKEFDLLTGLSKILAGDGHPQNGSGPKGEAEFKKHLREFKIADAIASSGLPEEKLHRLSQLLEKRRPAAFLFNAAFAEGPGGQANIVALWNLALQNQALFIPLGLESNVRGALEIAAHFRDGASSAREIGRSILGGAFKTLYVCGHLPRTERSPAEFMVVQDSYLGDAGEYADVILPATTFVESEGTFVNMEGRLQKFGPAIAPCGEARPGWRIICDLAGSMGLPGFAYETASAVFESLAKTVPAFRGLNGLERKAGTFVQEPAKDGRAFAVRTPSAEEAAPLYEHDPDRYKGLAMSRDIKSLNIVRGHK